MTISELLKLDYDARIEWLANKVKVSAEYMEDWFGACEGYGLDGRGTIRALVFARSIVGNDLDSWIYGDDLAEYVELVENGGA